MKSLRQFCFQALQSIKVRITLSAVAALALSTALSTAVLVREAEHDTLSTQRERELGAGARTAALLAHRVVELQRALMASAAQLDEASLADPARLAAFIEGKSTLRTLFSNVFVADITGRVLAVADAKGLRTQRVNIADREYFRQTVREQRPIISDPIASRASPLPLVVFTQPVRQGGRVVGVLAGALRLQSRDLLDELVDGSDGNGGALVVVTDRHGRILAHPQHERVMDSVANEPRMAVGYADWLGKGGAAGGAIEPSGLFLQQPGELLSAAGVAGPDWLVWRAAPESELLAPLHAARHKALAWAAVTVIGTTLLLLAVIGWLLRPLSLLKHRAQHLFDDHDDVHAGWPDVGGEIGELSRVLRHVGAERAQLERFNAQVLAQLGSVMQAAPLGILFTRAQRFELVSTEACRLLGRAEQDLLGQGARSIFAANEDYDALGPLVGAAFATNQSYVGEWRFRRADSDAFWGQLRGQPVEPGNPGAGTIWTLTDIGEQVRAREQLEWSAHHDTLTGLGNRKLFEQRVARLLAVRPAAVPAALVMIDLDRFKPINDSAGHAAGDAMLRTVAQAITACVRASDTVARLGGDEFALLLEQCPQDAATRIAGEVREAVAQAVLIWDGQPLKVGASLGVALLSAETASLADWLQQADAACYAAKADGRGVVRLATA